MNRDPRKPQLDNEVVELLRDEPELLAIADALRATTSYVPARARARLPRRSLALVAAVAVVSVGLVSIFESSSPTLVDRALAAVGNRPLIRGEFERTLPNDEVVDLTSGASRPSTVHVTAIADESTGLLRVRVAHDGEVVSDDSASAGVPAKSAGVDRVLASFVREYRPALRTRAVVAQRVGETDSLRLERAQVTVELTHDAQPRRIRGDGAWRVLTVVSTANRQLLVVPPRQRGVAGGDVVSRTPIAPTAARPALGGRALLPTVRGFSLRRAFSETLRSVTSKGSSRSPGLRLEFAGGGHRLVVLQALQPEAAYGFAEGRYTFEFNPVPTGAIDVNGRPGAWIGQMRLGGVFFTLRADDRKVLLTAARALDR